MGETLDARIAFLQRQLHAISLSIQDAKARGDTEALKTLGALWSKVSADIEQLKIDARNEDAPSAFMQALSGVSDEALKVAGQLRDAGVTAVTGVASLVKWLPLVVLGALVVLALIYLPKRKE